METIKIIATFIALFMIGCNDVELAPKTWYAEEGLQEAAQVAADLWCERSNGKYCPIVNDPNGESIHWTNIQDMNGSNGEKACGQFYYENYNRVNTPHRDITIAREYANPDVGCGWFSSDGTIDTFNSLVLIIAHELGHAAGLNDIDTPNTLMSGDRYVDGPTEIDVALIPESI
jgi:hypothetical protein